MLSVRFHLAVPCVRKGQAKQAEPFKTYMTDFSQDGAAALLKGGWCKIVLGLMDKERGIISVQFRSKIIDK